MPWLINASQLDKFRKNQKNVIILDATCHTPGKDNSQARQEFIDKHIIGARFFDISEFCDKDSPFPNMLTRDENQIADKLGALGITPENKIIIYDNTSMHTSCRALWMFKVFGHASHMLYILDGGISAWEKYGGKTETGEVRVTPKKYNVNYQAHYIRTLIQMKANLHHPKEQVVDVRNPVRYAGGPEKRAGLRAGHIPGSFNFPFTVMFENDGRFKPLDKIRKQLTGIGVDLSVPVVASCGSGTTAPILNFILDLFGQEDNAMYNGSWTEWGAEHLYQGEEALTERPVETSLDEDICDE